MIPEEKKVKEAVEYLKGEIPTKGGDLEVLLSLAEQVVEVQGKMPKPEHSPKNCLDCGRMQQTINSCIFAISGGYVKKSDLPSEKDILRILQIHFLPKAIKQGTCEGFDLPKLAQALHGLIQGGGKNE
jgi:hypothetical protein